MARAHAARSRRLSQAQGGGRGLVPRRASPRGWVRRTSWIIAADSIDLPVALRILAHQHREVHPRQHHLPQVVDVDADEAADLVDPANSLRADKLRRHPIVGALKEWARRRSDNARSRAQVRMAVDGLAEDGVRLHEKNVLCGQWLDAVVEPMEDRPGLVVRKVMVVHVVVLWERKVWVDVRGPNVCTRIVRRVIAGH